MDENKNLTKYPNFLPYSAMVLSKDRKRMYCCTTEGRHSVTVYLADFELLLWKEDRSLPTASNLSNFPLEPDFTKFPGNDNVEILLQLKLDREETTLLGTSSNGFVIWNLGNVGRVLGDFLSLEEEEDDNSQPQYISMDEAVVLHLPHGVRNISTRVLESNSVMLDANKQYAVAGVR